MKQPLKGEVWVHIDRLTRKDNKVWAVQFWTADVHHYECVKAVILKRGCFSQFFGPKAAQPKAVLTIPGGKVRIVGVFAYVY